MVARALCVAATANGREHGRIWILSDALAEGCQHSSNGILRRDLPISQYETAERRSCMRSSGNRASCIILQHHGHYAGIDATMSFHH